MKTDKAARARQRELTEEIRAEFEARIAMVLLEGDGILQRTVRTKQAMTNPVRMNAELTMLSDVLLSACPAGKSYTIQTSSGVVTVAAPVNPIK